ncbi:MAG TPA: YceD family protein [Burkholderiaceae bacterium]|nr:YceD family protein [Burkholderiaceae bacterium]
MDTQFIDTYKLTRTGLQVQGQAPMAQFSRFIAELPAQSDMVRWVIKGSSDVVGQQFLDLKVSAVPLVQCQRCMAVMPYPLELRSRLLVVQTEAELDVEDDPDASPDDWIEPVLASTHLDVLELVEDELILGLPYVPMHEHCATEVSSGENDEAVKPSPFAVLSQLKKD